MEKELLAQLASQEGSENGPLGVWPSARLAQFPQAGALTQVDGHWYVAVAGYRNQGTGEYHSSGMYSRWVRVPDEECQDWEP